MLKRAIDLALSLFTFAALFPFMAIIALLIKLDSRGSVLFVQDRLGLHGARFSMYKFRTMREGAETLGTGLFSFEDDPRVTRIGRYLRLFSLDELPQLVNVIRGDMSIVGPRPPVSYELGRYEDFSPRQRVRFRVKPGITGLAQVSGRNALDWDSKITMDNRYVALYRRRGIVMDFKILLLTVRVVASMRNVIEGDKGQVTSASPHP